MASTPFPALKAMVLFRSTLLLPIRIMPEPGTVTPVKGASSFRPQQGIMRHVLDVQSVQQQILRSANRGDCGSEEVMKERFAQLGAIPVGGTPEVLGKFIAAETTKWKEIVKISGAKLD